MADSIGWHWEAGALDLIGDILGDIAHPLVLAQIARELRA
jgi:hypothetical protein